MSLNIQYSPNIQYFQYTRIFNNSSMKIILAQFCVVISMTISIIPSQVHQTRPLIANQCPYRVHKMQWHPSWVLVGGWYQFSQLSSLHRTLRVSSRARNCSPYFGAPTWAFNELRLKYNVIIFLETLLKNLNTNHINITEHCQMCFISPK